MGTIKAYCIDINLILLVPSLAMVKGSIWVTLFIKERCVTSVYVHANSPLSCGYHAVMVGKYSWLRTVKKRFSQALTLTNDITVNNKLQVMHTNPDLNIINL